MIDEKEDKPKKKKKTIGIKSILKDIDLPKSKDGIIINDNEIIKSDNLKKLQEYEAMLSQSESSIVKQIPQMTLDSTTLMQKNALTETLCFKVNKNVKEILNLLLKIRYNTGETYFKYKLIKPETTSDFIRNLIIEEWERKKNLLVEIHKQSKK